jgi:type IV pilus assembly protein PilB
VARLEKKLGEILIGKALINSKQLKEAVQEQEKTREFLGTILLRKNFLKSEGLLKALSEQFNIPVVSLKSRYFDWDLVKSFSSELIINRKCFPLEQNDTQLVMAITNPLDLWAIQKAEEEARGLKLKLVLVSEIDMQEAISRYKEYIKANIDNLFK